MSAGGLLVAGGSGDDFREQGDHMTLAGPDSGVPRDLLLAERWTRSEAFVYD